MERLQDRTLLAAAVGDWERLDPAGSLSFQRDYDGDLSQTVELYSNGFESGALGAEWTTFSSTANGRVVVSNALGTPTQSGAFHLTMDTNPSGPNTLNEAVLTLNLAGQSDVELSFGHKDVNDEDTPLPASFGGHVFGDGVSISQDGVTWHTLASFNNTNSPNGVYTQFTFDLDAAAAGAGIAFDSDFHIKFQQADNFPFATDGRTFDNILVTASAPAQDSTAVFLEGGQTLTVIATPDDPDATLTIQVFDTDNNLLGTQTASGAGATVDLQTLGIDEDGNYRVEVSGDSDAEFALSLFRNAAVEVVDTADGAELDASGSFVSLGSGRWGIVGEFETQEGPGEEESRPLVWAIQPSSGDIVKIDPRTGTIVGQFAAPDALSSNHRVAGLSIAEEGNVLLYVNSGIDGSDLYRLDPNTGAILSVEFLPGTPFNRGGLSFESGTPHSIFAIDDGGPVDRQAGYGGALLDFTPAGVNFPGALGGDGHGRLFVMRVNRIEEYSPSVANTLLNSFALPPGTSGAAGLAFDGTHLYLSDANGTLFTLDPDTGAVLNSVTIPGGALIGLGADIVGGDPVLQSGPIFTTHNDGTRVGTINTTTGAGTDIGAFGSNQTWAAAFETDGTLYTLINGFSGNAVLATVDQTTGAMTTIGSGVGTSMINLEIAADGTMYGVGYFDQVLYRINKTTGSATAVGNTEILAVMDLAIDSAGVMYATVANDLFLVDQSTANTTFLGTFSNVTGHVMGIMFDHTDALYATVHGPNSPLYEINLTSLSATVIGSTAFNFPHGGDIHVRSAGVSVVGTQAITPAATPDIYGEPGEPGRFPDGPSAAAVPVAPSNVIVNGSFETGNFTGWTTITTAGPFRPWAVTGGGQGGGFGMLATQPQDGTFVAWNGFDGNGPMEFQMFQDVTIAPGSTATLSWMDRVQWNFTLGAVATLPRLYTVEIRDPATNALLQTVHSFSTGTQATNPTGNTNWLAHSADVSAFAGQTVRILFREVIPQSGTGPGQIEFDNITLVVQADEVREDMYAAVGRGSPINAGAVLLVDQTTGVGTLVGDPVTPGGLTGLDVDSQGRMWGSSIDGPVGNRVSRLVEIDPETGASLSSVAITFNGLPISIGDLAIQPGTDAIYGVRSNADNQPNIPGGLIVRIDRTTGAATIVGNPNQGNGGGLAFTPDGTLYFLNFNELYRLNPNNAAILGTTLLNFGGHDGLGVRPSDGALFATANQGGDQIYRIDPVAGTSTLVGRTLAGSASDLAFLVTEITTAEPDVDEYLLDLTGLAGKQIDVALSLLGGEGEPEDVTLELLGTDGATVLATGVSGADNIELGILDFTVTQNGVYTVRVTGHSGRYGIAVTEDLVFDTEPNTPADTLRNLDPVNGALGFLGGGSDVDLSLLTGFESLAFNNSFFIPPDPIIAAGPDVVITMVNTDIAIHSKSTGAVLAAADLDGVGGFWNTNQVVFDPWITYDPHSERFIAIGIDRSSVGPGSSRLYLAVSTDSTPTNLTTDWHKYIINRTGTHQLTGGTTFPDYPKLGVNEDAIFITANDFGILSGGFSHASLFAIDKSSVLSGGPLSIVRNEVITGNFSIHPVDNFDAGPEMFFAQTSTGTGNTVRIHTLNSVTGARTVNTVIVPAYAFPNDVPQLGGPLLDSVDGRIMSGVVRDGSLWTAHAIVDPAVDGETLVRWYQFDITGAAPVLVQSGNVDPGPGLHAWMAHINVDNDGDMAIGFSVSGPNQFAGIGYTGRLAGDAPGTTRAVEIARVGTGSYSLFDGIGRNRWGDYSGLAIDPDGETFWLYNEYAAAGNSWGTFVGAFQIDATTSDTDTYEITLSQGDSIGFRTQTPFDSPIDGLNALDPAIRILDPNGVEVAFDSNSFDGKNAEVVLTPGLTGVYKVIVETDAGSGVGEYLLTTFNVNDAPVITSLALSSAVINEDDSVTLTGTYTDPDAGDTHELEINWGDGPAVTYNVSGGSFSVTYQYLDDTPTGTASDLYTVTGVLRDSAGGETSLGGGTAGGSGSLVDVEPNDTIGSAQSLDGLFSLAFNPNIGDTTTNTSTTIPHVTVFGTGNNTVDVFSFTVSAAGARGIFDIDFGMPDVDSWLNLRDSAGTIIASDDDSSTTDGQGGSNHPFDSYLEHVFTAPGVYYIEVGRFFGGAPLPNGSDYQLQVSLETAFTVLVNNVDPVITSLSATSVDENGVVTLSGTYDDQGTLDTHELAIDWGEGPVQIVSVSGGSFSVTHPYLDDNPSGTAFDVYTISVTLTDDDTGSDTASTTTTITNVDPEITELSNSSPNCGVAGEGETVTISGLFTDIGTQDVHSAVIDWGDGQQSNALITQGAGSGGFDGSHTYATGGVYTVTVTLTDDDGGTDVATTTAVITGVGVVDGTLYVIGTHEDDHVTINQTGSVYRVHADFLGTGSFRDVPVLGVTNIVVQMCAGNDHVTISGGITLPTLIDGGDGNDHLNGGSGPNIILGGGGDDKLLGGNGRDILIGGLGADQLVGNGGEDLLIAGWTDFDEFDPDDHYQALQLIMAEWNGGASLSTRKDRLTGVSGDGANGTFFLDASTVHDDAVQDKLNGGSATDWFFANLDAGVLDKITGLAGGEETEDID